MEDSEGVRVIQIAEQHPAGKWSGDSLGRVHHMCDQCKAWVYEWHVHSTDGEFYAFPGPIYDRPSAGSLVLIKPVKSKFEEQRWKIIENLSK